MLGCQAVKNMGTIWGLSPKPLTCLRATYGCLYVSLTHLVRPVWGTGRRVGGARHDE